MILMYWICPRRIWLIAIVLAVSQWVVHWSWHQSQLRLDEPYVGGELVVVMEPGYAREVAESYSTEMMRRGWVQQALVKDAPDHEQIIGSTLRAELPDDIVWPFIIHAMVAPISPASVSESAAWLKSRQGVSDVLWDQPLTESTWQHVSYLQSVVLWQRIWTVVAQLLLLVTSWWLMRYVLNGWLMGLSQWGCDDLQIQRMRRRILWSIWGISVCLPASFWLFL